MHGMAVWHGTSGRDRDESRQAKCVTGGKSCIVRASACLLDAAKERAQRLARPRRNSSSTGQWRKRWPGARVVDALSPTNYCWCWCWCCCSRWRSHYLLLLLSSRSSDHTLMHVVRTRIQTRWQAANRREPESDPRAFHQHVSASVTASSNGIYHPQSSSSRTATMLTRRGCRHPNLPTVLDGPRSCDHHRVRQ
jgi:hypothetical protein